MQNYFRNGCIALSCSMAAMAANAEGGSAAAAAAAAALDTAKSDVDATAPKVMLVVATVVGVVILIGLMRKA
ncbi:Flexible pilin [Aeromonas caviae]|uniref:Flexible pilin n=1 Tax=Aeromonas TaxID=642 RepID=UPI0012453CA5|nr:Flexible pilin [Aeromonas caviae]KAB0683411.1 Flexible pilin [Aeromonas caviae]MDN6870764.1 Flexible pilin [Aeromonas caviae]MDX7787099.1 Flexible pilin [Aeromonas caviae]MDX7853473.1 Flexible pilin [Aeromonas caviae]MDX7871666.1 Flexible pilin [Aeromonas caviae]